jgi:hypothetical protein
LKSDREMNYIRHFASILIFIFLTAYSVAENEQGNFLPLNDPAADELAKQDIEDNTEGEDIFDQVQDAKSNTLLVVMEKNNPVASVDSEPPLPKGRLLSPLNKWNLDLQDAMDRVVELEMYLSNDVVFGKGTIVVENVVQNATATGTFQGNKLNMDILSSDLTLYRLLLTRNGKSLSGDYHGYSAKYVTWKGIAMGKIN